MGGCWPQGLVVTDDDTVTPPLDELLQRLHVVSLPMRGHVDSLNVSAAAAVLLYGILDARGAQK